MNLRKKPLLLHYFVTDGCNCKCSFCNIWKNAVDFAEIDDIKTNLLAAKKIGCKFVDFTGGEPLMNKNLVPALKEAKKLGYFTSVTTNGILLEKQAKSLVKLVDFFHVSLDGTNEIHNKLRGVNCYESVLKGVDAAIQNKIKPDILFTLTDENKDNIEDIYRYCRKNKLILILDPLFSYFGNKEDKRLDKFLNKWVGKFGIYVNRAFLQLRNEGGNNFENPICKAVTSTIVIDTKNNLLLPCMHKAQDKISLKDFSLMEAFNSLKHKEIEKKQGTYSFCDSCSINCYMDPSFHYKLDKFFINSMYSKTGYVLDKIFRRFL